MTPPGVSFAIAVVRVWTHVYTWGLPPGPRELRRDEVDSDLWESVQCARPGERLALQIWTRLLGGVVDDLGWRLEQASVAAVLLTPIVVTTFLLLIAGMWVFSATRTPLPEFPLAPPARIGPDLIDVPPPPPPPPPCPPPGVQRDQRAKCIE